MSTVKIFSKFVLKNVSKQGGKMGGKFCIQTWPARIGTRKVLILYRKLLAGVFFCVCFFVFCVFFCFGDHIFPSKNTEKTSAGLKLRFRNGALELKDPPLWQLALFLQVRFGCRKMMIFQHFSHVLTCVSFLIFEAINKFLNIFTKFRWRWKLAFLPLVLYCKLALFYDCHQIFPHGSVFR